jgi:hypothetical protein
MRRTVIALVACVVLVTSCSGDRSTTRVTGPSVVPVGVDSQTADLIEETRVAAAQMERLTHRGEVWLSVDDAITTLINRCLREAGLAFQQPLPSTRSSSDPQDVDQMSFYLVSPDGYGLAEYLASARQVPDAPMEPSLEPLEAEQIGSALWGDEAQRSSVTLRNGSVMSFPTTGCQAEAEQEVYGYTVAEYQQTRLLLPTLSEVIAEAYGQAAVVDAEDRWGECMRAGGFDLQSITELITEAFQEFTRQAEDGDSEDALASWEQDLGAQDAACKVSSRFATEFSRALLAAIDRAKAADPAMYSRAAEIEAHAIGAAAEILGP